MNPLLAMRDRFASETVEEAEPKTEFEVHQETHTKHEIDAATNSKGNFNILKCIGKKNKKLCPAVIAVARAELSALATSCST